MGIMRKGQEIRAGEVQETHALMPSPHPMAENVHPGSMRLVSRPHPAQRTCQPIDAATTVRNMSSMNTQYTVSQLGQHCMLEQTCI